MNVTFWVERYIFGEIMKKLFELDDLRDYTKISGKKKKFYVYILHTYTFLDKTVMVS